MKPTRLNLKALRKNVRTAATIRRDGTGGADMLDAQLSRRRWFGVAASAAILATPAFKAVGKTLSGSLVFTHDKRSAAFTLPDGNQWVIDTRRFAGSPELRVSKNDGEILIEMSHAHFPATPYSADFAARIIPAFFGHRIEIRFSLGEFSGGAAFESWLQGTEDLVSSVRLNEKGCRLNRRYALELRGDGEATYLPDWTMKLEGSGIGRCDFPGAELVCDDVALRLPPRDEERVMKDSTAKRTIVLLSRGEREWLCSPPGHPQTGWTFASIGSPFDLVRIEAAERRDGFRNYAFVAESHKSSAGLIVCPGLSLRGFDDGPLGLPLRNVRYAAAFDRAGDQHAVLARFSDEPLWLGDGIAGFQVSDTPDASPFELVTEGRKLKKVQCAPSLLQSFVPLPDAIVEPTSAPLGSRLVFTSTQDKQAKPAVQSPQAAAQAKPQDQLKLNLPIPTVSAVRPEDLVKIDFDFKNLVLQKSGSQTVLVRDKGGPSYLIATLPPQNIAERAYYETSAGCGQTQKEKDAGRPAYPGGPENLENPPIASRIAGPSRLVFVIPASAKPIPFTLEGLLRACSENPLSVSTNAAQLTPDQKKVLAWLQSQGKKARATFTTAMGTAQSLHSKVANATAAKGVRDAVQQSMAGLKAATSVAEQLPPGVGPSKAIQKRFLTLQNALVHSSTHSPEDAKKYTQALTNFWDLAQQSDLFSGIEGLETIAANVFAQVPTSPKSPESLETAIESPYRLIISPNGYAGWAHIAKLPSTDGKIELWHTRLGVLAQGAVLETIEGLRTIRAIWTPDSSSSLTHAEGASPNDDSNPFRMSVDRRDRYEIVHLTSDFSIKQAGRFGIVPTPWEPLPVNVDSLMLSSLGAWMNFRGAWDPPAPLSIETWRHRSTMGRDHYVKVVYAGYLFPFGHRASLVKITERKFQTAPNGQVGAYLRQRMFIIIREPEKNYPGEGQDNVRDGYHNAWRNPFRTIRILTLITPNLDSPSNSGITDGNNVNQGQSAFWPYASSQPFKFHMRGEDWDGNPIEFATPAIFVDQTASSNASVLDHAEASLKSRMDTDNTNLNRAALYGQKVALADSQQPGDTSFETDAVSFGCERNVSQATSLLAAKHPPFYPILESMQVRIKAIEQLIGPAGSRLLTYDDTYGKHGFDASANKGEVFARMADASQEISIDFSSDPTKAGGLVTPNMVIKGLSRSIGAVGGNVDDARDGKFNPDSFFSEFKDSVKIFGALPLTAILNLAQSLDRVPQIQSVNTGQFVDTRVVWHPQLAKSADGLFVPSDADNGMTVNVNLHTPLDGSAATSSVEAVIKDFMLQLLPTHPFIGVKFESVRLRMQSGQKQDVEVKLAGDGLVFLGELSFVNELRKFVPSSGFSDPPYLDVSLSGITIGYTQPIPTIAMGMFSLQNISLGASFEIPFDGRAVNIGFAFCTRENPFLLTVSIFGGGGFFGIKLDPHGLQKLEASLEFGGAVAINLGVASGGVYVLAGFYYYNVVTESGYEAHLRCGGCLTVLGLVSLSVEFYMGITYQSDGTMFGEASVEVEVSIAFFSKSVTLHTTRQFAGSPNDPLVSEVLSEQDWNNYLLAFAA